MVHPIHTSLPTYKHKYCVGSKVLHGIAEHVHNDDDELIEIMKDILLHRASSSS
jgi:hypothetical protein